MNYINKGWPNNRRECDPNAALFFNYRDELSSQDGIIFKGETIVITRQLRRDMLE